MTMKTAQQELLRPSLGGQRGRAPYSGTMLFFSAFFGGPLVALAGFALNVHRLQRWRADVLPLLLAAGLLLAAMVALQSSPWKGELALRLLALALVLAGLWRHRLEQRAADLMGAERPKGLLIGIGLVIAGWHLTPLFEGMLR